MFSSKKVYLFVILSFICAVLPAQDYVYPVATGASWAREIFAQAEKAQMEENRKQHANNVAKEDQSINFADIFSRFDRNYSDHQLYEDSIFFDISNEKWKGMFSRRARKYSKIYAENNDLLNNVKVYFGRDDVPDASYDSLYYWTRHLYHKNMGDLYLIDHLVDMILIPHYESKNDYDRLMFCYSCAGMNHYQFSRIGDAESSKTSYDFYRKALDLRDRYASFKDPLSRYYLIASFVNLCILHVQEGNMSIQESRDLLDDMWDRYNDPEIRRIMTLDLDLERFAIWSLHVYCLRSIMTYINQDMDDEEILYKLYTAYSASKKQLGGDLAHLKFRFYAKVEYDDLIVEAFMGHITWDEAYEQFSALLEEDPELSKAKGFAVYRMNYMYNLFTSHLYIVGKTSLNDEEKCAEKKNILNHVLDCIKHFEHGSFPYETGLIMANIATHPKLMQCLNSEEKRYLIYHLLVLEQPTTYVHSSMVADLSLILTDALIETHPEYFSRIPQLACPDSVRAHKSELSEFIYRAALYHDIGKISMPTIVNNNYRQLTDREFMLVKSHTTKAEQYFSIEPDFRKYAVVALAHHKWYNGEEGYPDSFDNVKATLFPIINIVTLCDCMDAATVNVGRNYHTPKSFEEVMNEFRQGAGTRYDPTLVDLIDHNSDLYSKMKQKVLFGRTEHYYKTYRSYLRER